MVFLVGVKILVVRLEGLGSFFYLEKYEWLEGRREKRSEGGS